jgi:succinate dehydrogenase hydrophobic anchor subunit
METYSVLLCSKQSNTEYYDVQAELSQHHYDLFILGTILLSSFHLCLGFPSGLFSYDLQCKFFHTHHIYWLLF